MNKQNQKGKPMKNTVTLLFLVLVALAFLFTSAYAAADTVNYTYDDAGRLIKVDYSDGKAIEYTYDKAGNLLQRAITAQAPDSGGNADGGGGGGCFISAITKD
jgi:YD repeat-containing protein